MSWGKVILIITAIIAMVIALYFLLGILGINLAEIFIPTKPYQELTSMAALACAVDVVGTQNIGVKTCDKSYKWGEANVFETITGYFVRAKYLFTGNAVGASKDFDVICMPNPSAQYASPTKKGFLCESRRGDKSFVECWKEDDRWKCKVIGFYLEQQFSDDIAKQVLQRAIEVVKGEIKDFFEKCLKGEGVQYCLPIGLGRLWVGFAGEPKYLVYYETFPTSMEGIWTVDVSDVAVSTIAMGGALNCIGGAISGLKIIGAGIKAGAKPFLHLHFREAGKKFMEAAKTKFWQEMAKTWAGKIALKKLAEAGAYPSILIKESAKEMIEEGITRATYKEMLEENLPIFAAARTVARELGLGDAAGDAWAQNILDKIQAWAMATKGKELTVDVMKEIIDESIPESLSKESKEFLYKEFSKSLGKEDIDEVCESLVEAINKRDISERIFSLEILGDATKEGTEANALKKALTSEILEKMMKNEDIKKMLVISALKGQEKKEFLEILTKSGIVPEAYKKIYEEEVEEIALHSVHSALAEYKYLRSVEEAVGLKEKLTNIIKGRINLAWEELKAQGFKERLFEGMAIRISSRLGLGPEDWIKRLVILGAAGAFTYYDAGTSVIEKFKTCGANSLCLHTQHFFRQNNYNISLLTNKIVATEYESDNLVNQIALTFGFKATDPKKVRGFVISPCKADILVEEGKIKCKGYISKDTLAYIAPFKVEKRGGKVYIDFGYIYGPEGEEIDKCAGSLPSLNRTNFWQELQEKNCISFSHTFKIENYKEYCSHYTNLEDCRRGHFIEQFKDILNLPDDELDEKLIFQYDNLITPTKPIEKHGLPSPPPVTKGEEKRQILLATPLGNINMQVNVITGEEEVITSCEPPGDIPFVGYEIWWEGEEVDSVVIKADRTSMKEYYEKDPRKNTNYCIPYAGKELEWYEKTLRIAQVIPWETVLAAVGSFIAPGVGTAIGYAAGMAINFAVGSAGAISSHVQNIENAWPTNQFS
jgi:hypothetical protein